MGVNISKIKNMKNIRKNFYSISIEDKKQIMPTQIYSDFRINKPKVLIPSKNSAFTVVIPKKKSRFHRRTPQKNTI